MSVTTVAPSAMPSPPTGPRRPPANKKGFLSRRAVTIPKIQMGVLNNDASWFSNISSGDESAIRSFRAVPDHVRKQLQNQHSQRPPAAEASRRAHSPQASPTAATAGSLDQAEDADYISVDVSVEDPHPHPLELAAAQDLPSTISPPSLRTQVSPPPARATAPSRVPLVTTQPGSANAPPELCPALAGSTQTLSLPPPIASTQPAAPVGLAAAAAFVAPSSAPERSENSCQPHPRQRQDRPQTISPHKGVARLQTAEQVDREASEIPATPETLLQRQSQQPADAPPVPYSPSWPDADEDDSGGEENDEAMGEEADEEEEAGDIMQQDGADQEDEGHMSQLLREQTAATTATTGRQCIDRGLSPNLSSSPPDDIEFQPVQALPAADQPAASMALPAPSLPSHTPSSTHQDQFRAQPVSKQADSTAPWPAPVRASLQTTALPPPPSPNSSRAPSEDSKPSVRRRLMKAPVFPSSSKPKRAAAPSRMETPDPALYGTGYASRKCSSLVRLYPTTANKNSSSPPSTPGADRATEMLELDANDTKRRDSVRSTVEKHISEAVHEDVVMADTVISAPVSAPPVSAPPPVDAVDNSAAPCPAPAPFVAVESASPSPAAAPTNAAITPAFKVRGPVYDTPAANASAITPFAGRAVSIGQSPSMSPRHTWMLPYETFTSAYPDYTGDLEDFLRACYCLQGIAKARQLASYQFDDVVRSYLEYIEYVHDDACTTPLNLHQWYIENTDELLYNKKVVTRSNVDAILAAYPDKVQSIQQLAEQGTQIAKKKQADKPAPAVGVVVDEPPAAHEEAPADSNNTFKQLAQQDQPDSAAPLTQPQSLPAGRCFPVDEVHNRDSQYDSGPSNSLLNMSILGSSCESVWPHGQPSSPLDIHHVGGASPSQFLSQDASQDGSLSVPGSIPRPDSQIQSSGFTNAEHALQHSSPPIRTSALPPGMDRITYMLQSLRAMDSSDPLVRPHIPSQTVESASDPAGDDPNWALADDENAHAVVETPAKAPAAARAKTTRLKSPAAAPTPISRKRSWDDREHQPPPSSAANPIVVEDNTLDNAALGHTVTVVHEVIDDHESGDDNSGVDVSLMSVQSARDVRQPSPAAKPKPTGASRRVTIAASDIGMAARMAAAEEALARASQSHKDTATPAPLAAKMTTTATANGPPKKKRKPTAASKTSISRKALADFLAKKAQATGAANRPWLK